MAYIGMAYIFMDGALTKVNEKLAELYRKDLFGKKENAAAEAANKLAAKEWLQDPTRPPIQLPPYIVMARCSYDHL